MSNLGFGNAFLGLRVFERQVPVKKVANRTHPRKKTRLQKKWLTRYGAHFENAISQAEIKTIYRTGNDVYCYTPMAYELRRQIAERERANPYGFR